MSLEVSIHLRNIANIRNHTYTQTHTHPLYQEPKITANTCNYGKYCLISFTADDNPLQMTTVID